MSNLAAALAYAERGWKVFPLAHDSKRPLTPHGFHDASCDPAELAEWWGMYPDAWLALWCRGSGLIAVDVDPRNGGLQTFARLEAKFGPLPRTLVQQSGGGGGGMHIFMSDPSPGPTGWTRNGDLGGEIRGKADAAGCGRGVDIKCNGYTVLEPSGRYRWLTDPGTTPPPVPETWVIGVLRKPPAELGEAPGADGIEDWAEPSDPGPLPLADRERLRADLRALGPRASGGGTTFAAVLRIFHDFGLSLEDGYSYLLEWNAGCGSPRGEAELHRQIRNIVGGGRAQGARGNRRSDISGGDRIARATVDIGSWVLTPRPEPAPVVAEPAAPATTSTVLALLATLPSAGPAPEPLAHETAWATTLEQAADDVSKVLAVESQPQTAATIEPMFENVERFFKRTFPDEPWLVDGLLTEGGVHVLAGEAKSAKTWSNTEIAVALATSTPVFGKFKVDRPRQVAYFFAEDGGPSVQRRIKALVKNRPGCVDGWQRRMHVQPRGRQVDLTRDIDVAIIVASCRMLGQLDLLVLDPLRDIHSGEEDSADAMRPVIKRMSVIGDLLGCTVMFAHHMGKASADSAKRRPGGKMRGSSAIDGGVDDALFLEDLRGDGTNKFISAVTSRVRAGRSAGTFDLTLDIIDNAHGMAESATWEISERKVETKESKAEASIADVLMTMFDFGAPMTEKTIQHKLGGSKPVISACFTSAKRAGLVDVKMAGTTNMGWVLTQRGIDTVRAGTAKDATPTTPAPHPATAGICDVPVT